jgi:Fur family transcriptional regulator, peroxide stress response regulator
MPGSTIANKEHLAVFERACRDAGLRLTHQRMEIYRELAESHDHPSVESLHQRLRRRIPTLSMDTVYRTLATFAGLRLINKVETVEAQGRYEVALNKHHHLICSRCNTILDFHWPAIDKASLPDGIGNWGRIDNKNVVVYGVCRKCLS